MEIEFQFKNEKYLRSNFETAINKIQGLEIIGDKMKGLISKLLEVSSVGSQIRSKIHLSEQKLREQISKLQLLSKNEHHYKSEIKQTSLKIEKES